MISSARPESFASPCQPGGSIEPLCRAKRGSRARSAALREPGIEPNQRSRSMNFASMPLIRGEPSARSVASVLCTWASSNPRARRARSGATLSISAQLATAPTLHRSGPPRRRVAFEAMRTATLFDADAASYTGTIEVLGVIFRAEDDGYAVLEVQETAGGDGFALVGPVAHLVAGDRAEVSGEGQAHSRYGRQLRAPGDRRARGALPLDPTDREGQIAYLSSLRHIGKRRAEKLVEAHGEEVLQVIAAAPQRTFQALKGVSVDQAAAATASWHESRAVRELHVQLAPHGLGHLAAPIPARYGERATTILHEDPYRLTEVEGVGFARADKIALAADMPPESDKRAQAAAVYILREAEQGGNSFLPMEELAERTARLIGLRADPAGLAGARGVGGG